MGASLSWRFIRHGQDPVRARKRVHSMSHHGGYPVLSFARNRDSRRVLQLLLSRRLEHEFVYSALRYVRRSARRLRRLGTGMRLRRHAGDRFTAPRIYDRALWIYAVFLLFGQPK